MLKEKIASEETIPKVSNIFRASEVGECETYLCHERLGHSPVPFTGRVRHMLQDGVVHEHDIVSRLKAAGIIVLHSYVEGQAEVCCSQDPLVIGHPDGVLDVPKNEEFVLDYADENFEPSRFMMLEVTAPNHFTFLRLERSHLREILPRKFVQIQMYLNSEEIRSYGNCAVVIVKNKNTSALYEEGISFDVSVVMETLEKLKRVEDLTQRGLVSSFRCDDWRRNYCRYRHLCVGEEEMLPVVSSDILKGESLNEAETLKEAAEVWRRGKLLKLEGEDLIADSRDQFAEIIRQYGARGLTIGEDVKALMIAGGVNRRVNYDVLRSKFPDVYNECVTEGVREAYVRVSD